MSFDVDMISILHYGNNILASSLPLIWPFVGGAFALFIVGGLIYIFHKMKGG